MNQGSPLRNRFDFDQGSRRVDVLNPGRKVIPAVGVAINVQQVRPDVDDVLGLLGVNISFSVVDSAVKQIHIAEELVDERRGGVIVTSSGDPTCSILPRFITTTR